MVSFQAYLLGPCCEFSRDYDDDDTMDMNRYEEIPMDIKLDSLGEN
ncbi:hypothetical protein PP707_01550 [Acetobacter pasteurianus]|nr:hypothetical protein [Acetobacter pasteurianus]